MTPSPFFAQPPLLMGRGQDRTFRRELWHLLRVVFRALLQVVIPFNPTPEPPDDPPAAPETELSEEQLEQCKRIFEQVEATRDGLEQKAHATFNVVGFLAPVLGAIFVFVVSQSEAGTVTRRVVISVSVVTALCLALAFVSVIRAVGVHAREELFLGSVIDLDAKTFRKYDGAFYARGLLYCASVNAAMNAHLAQFVRAAQILALVAVLACTVASVPVAVLMAETASTPKTTTISGKVEVSSGELEALRTDVAQLTREIVRTSSNEELVKQVIEMRERIARLETTAGASAKARRNRTASPP